MLREIHKCSQKQVEREDCGDYLDKNPGESLPSEPPSQIAADLTRSVAEGALGEPFGKRFAMAV